MIPSRDRPLADVPVRRPDFADALSDLPKHFMTDGDVVGSHVIAVLSSIFPPGEQYFVRAVRRVRDHVTDPALVRATEGFIGQEDMHGDRHHALNQRLAELGYPTQAIERYVETVARWSDRRLPAMTNLAVTAALEHHTAIVAETLLAEPDARDRIGHDDARHLFLWHALEESEHKAVAFDLYRALDGSERQRVWTMRAMNVLFALEVGAWTVLSLARDRQVWRHPWRTVINARDLIRSPFVSRRVLRRLRDYTRRGFHPDDHDTSALIERWRDELFGPTGTLRPTG